MALAENKHEIEEQVDQIVKDYAERGLRTLAVARTAASKDLESLEESKSFFTKILIEFPRMAIFGSFIGIFKILSLFLIIVSRSSSY